ncbi:MAG: carbamoyltransferase HypF, partial [Lachnospiraceae bacterium]|nr:carbamoyltransferase HypF [Candidatus Equihabitans merdae]
MITKRICVYGIVQGVGFRPTVSRHAMRSGITGSVCNKGPFVEIIAQGTESCLETFIDLLKNEPPRMASILRINVENVEITGRYESFDIIESEKTAGEVFISPDLAICPDCERELFDPKNPRYLHPFINCTCCGPRLTILDALPYDRERTSMKAFPMCDFCQGEYTDPATRRYDAQPVCCPNCGPKVYAFAGGGELSKIDWDRLPDPSWQDGIITDAFVITVARRTIASGGIVAVKGIGGFHLCCDATSQEAVLR